jgi:hypothetical protein
MNGLKLLYLVDVMLIVGLFAGPQAVAQNNQPDNPPPMKFKTDYVPKKTQEFNAPLKFKIPDKDASSAEKKEDYKSEPIPSTVAPTDEPFKLYPGYPKVRLQIASQPTVVSSTFTYGTTGFNYNNTNTSGFGSSIIFQGTPAFKAKLFYSTYTAEVYDATVNALSITKSTIATPSYGASFSYCNISDGNFLTQLCGVFELGNDGYPLLDFASSSTLSMTQVRDNYYGIGIGYQWPILTNFLFHVLGGVNIGTGTGNSGALTSKTNSSIYFDGSIEWIINENHSATVGVNAKQRAAKVAGRRGTNDDTWETKLTSNVFALGYIYTF